MPRRSINDEEIIRMLGSADSTRINAAISYLYQHYKNRICAEIKKRGGTQEDAEEVFQDALIGVWRNVQQDKYQSSASLSTYIYQISINQWRKLLRDRGESRNWQDIPESSMSNDVNFIYEFQDIYERFLARLDRMGQPCKTILMMYIQGFSMKEIAEVVGLGTVDNAKAHKYNCIKKLGKIEF